MESYGAGIYWQMALGGLLAGAASGGFDAGHYYGWRGGRDGLPALFNVAVNSFGKDMGKSFVYHGLNSKYNKKNSYWNNLLTTNGSGLNLGMGIGAFFYRINKMRNLLIISISIFISGCYATHSKPQAFLDKIYLNGNQIRVDPKRIITKFLYDSLDYRIRYGIKNDPNMLNRGHLFYQMQNYIQQQLDSSFPFAAKVSKIDTGLGNIDFDSIFLFTGKRFRSEYKFEFHRSPYWPIYTRFDSVWLSPDYSHLTNTLIAEFKLLKMYRDGRGSVPGFEADIFLRFGYINKLGQVQVYRNFLSISSKSIDGGVFWRNGNENIDWWRPRHIDELVKRMQYELRLTDKKGKALPVQ